MFMVQIKPEFRDAWKKAHETYLKMIGHDCEFEWKVLGTRVDELDNKEKILIKQSWWKSPSDISPEWLEQIN